MGHRMPLSELSIVHKTGHHELSLLSSEPLPCVLTLAHCHRCFPGDSDAEESARNAGAPSSIPESGISPGEGKGYSHEIKRHVLLGRKVMINLVSILKSRDIALSTKVCLVKAMVFPVVMYGCESWTIKKAEHRRIDAFEDAVGCCWRRLLKSSLNCKEIQPVHPKGDQSWVFIGRTDVEAETPILWPPDVKS